MLNFLPMFPLKKTRALQELGSFGQYRLVQPLNTYLWRRSQLSVGQRTIFLCATNAGKFRTGETRLDFAKKAQSFARPGRRARALRKTASRMFLFWVEDLVSALGLAAHCNGPLAHFRRSVSSKIRDDLPIIIRKVHPHKNPRVQSP